MLKEFQDSQQKPQRLGLNTILSFQVFALSIVIRSMSLPEQEVMLPVTNQRGFTYAS